MINFKLYKNITLHKGAALIIFTIVISLLTLLFVLKTLNIKDLEMQRKEKTAMALFEAKSALLGWSVIQDRPGLLPCPEDLTKIGTSDEGHALISCGFAIGRLPLKTLGLGDLRDGNGDQLWYALSNGFGDNSILINSSILGQLSINGTTNATIAIIFSPGTILSGQVRTAPTNVAPPSVSDYLDLTNNDGDNAFTNTGGVNDTLIAISHADLFDIVAKRLLREIRGNDTQGLVRFFNTNSYFPFADNNNDGISDSVPNGNPTYQTANDADTSNIFFSPSTLNIMLANNWMQQINYQLISPTNATISLNGQVLSLP